MFGERPSPKKVDKAARSYVRAAENVYRLEAEWARMHTQELTALQVNVIASSIAYRSLVQLVKMPRVMQSERVLHQERMAEGLAPAESSDQFAYRKAGYPSEAVYYQRSLEQ